MHILNNKNNQNNTYDSSIIEGKDLLVLQQLAAMLTILCAHNSGRCMYIS
jgi:hypothetical protein